MPFWDLNCLYIPQYHFHPLHYTVHSPLFLLEIVDVDRWEEYKMPVGRGGGVIMRHVELNDRHLRSHGKIRDCEQSKYICAEFKILLLTVSLYSIAY